MSVRPRVSNGNLRFLKECKKKGETLTEVLNRAVSLLVFVEREKRDGHKLLVLERFAPNVPKSGKWWEI